MLCVVLFCTGLREFQEAAFVQTEFVESEIKETGFSISERDGT